MHLLIICNRYKLSKIQIRIIQSGGCFSSSLATLGKKALTNKILQFLWLKTMYLD